MGFFKDVEDLRKVMKEVHASAEDVLSYVDDGAKLYMRDALSADYYEEYLAALETVDWVKADLSVPNQDVFDDLRKAAACYGAYEAMPTINANFSNAGNMGSSGEGKSPLRQWEYNEGLQKWITKADRFMDMAIETMEGTPGNYATWAGSEAFTIQKKLLLTNTKDFERYGKVSISKSRRTFLALAPFQELVMDEVITECMGETLLASLLLKLSASTPLAAKETILLEKFIYPALAHYTLVEAAPNLSLDISTQGIRIVSTQDGITSKDLHEKAFNQWRTQMLGTAKIKLSKAKKYLDDNSADFADYTSDDASENGTPNYEIPDNSSSQSSVMF